MSGVPMRMPNPSQYLSVAAKASKNHMKDNRARAYDR
jgi:hypothetical protein